MFDFPLVAGSHKSFHDKNTIFLSEELAKKYFGDEDPIGKILVINFVNDTEIEVFVGGVVKKFPINNSFTFQALMRMEHFIDIHKIKMDDWSDWRNPATFLELSSPENANRSVRNSPSISQAEIRTEPIWLSIPIRTSAFQG